jgi:hypothetical protein
VTDHHNRYAQLRYTAAGAIAALAAAGAIAGASALAAKPRADTHRHAALTKSPPPNGPASSMPTKTPGSEPSPSPQPFLNDIQQLVASGTISAAQGQALDREIEVGRVDTDTLASSGFTQAQLQAVQQSLSTTKESLAPGRSAPTSK